MVTLIADDLILSQRNLALYLYALNVAYKMIDGPSFDSHHAVALYCDNCGVVATDDLSDLGFDFDYDDGADPGIGLGHSYRFLNRTASYLFGILF